MSKAPERTVCFPADDAPLRARASNYPEAFRSQMAKRQKRPLGDLFGIWNFGVNLTRLLPGGISSLMHRHDKQDEFIYILEGQPTLATDQGEFELKSGMCAAFRQGLAHHLINRTASDVVYLEIGDRSRRFATYPNEISGVLIGAWQFLRKEALNE